MSRRLLVRAVSVPFVLVVLLFIGAAGYHALEDMGWLDALYMTVSTVGFGEVAPLSVSGKVSRFF